MLTVLDAVLMFWWLSWFIFV